MRRMAEEDRGIGFSQQVMDEAADALVSVGWSAPSSGDAELTSSDPFVQSIDASIQRDFGVRLDELLNPAKVCMSFAGCVCQVGWLVGVYMCRFMIVMFVPTYLHPKSPAYAL